MALCSVIDQFKTVCLLLYNTWLKAWPKIQIDSSIHCLNWFRSSTFCGDFDKGHKSFNYFNYIFRKVLSSWIPLCIVFVILLQNTFEIFVNMGKRWSITCYMIVFQNTILQISLSSKHQLYLAREIEIFLMEVEYSHHHHCYFHQGSRTFYYWYSKEEYSKEELNILAVRSCHVTNAFQSESTLYSCLNVKELLAWSSREIWSF